MHNVPQHWAVNCVKGRVGIKDVDIDKYKIHQKLKVKMETFIQAAQNQSLFTCNYHANIIKTPKEYEDWHLKIGQYIHWKILQHSSSMCHVHSRYR